MTQIQDIRKMYFDEGKNITTIGKESGVDRKTIRKYISIEDWNTKEKSADAEPDFPKLEPYKNEIEEWLEADKKARRKQRHTARRVFNRLREKYSNTFDCSYRTVAYYVKAKKKELYSSKNGFLPLQHIPGEAQVDFGDCDFYENGKLVSGHHLNLSFPFSNKGYTQLFKGENQECLFEGLKNIFMHIGGVPHRIWFDNASTVVINATNTDNRQLNEKFIRFKEHYRFEAALCNVHAGHEKGNVEGKVGYHRRNLFVPVPEVGNILRYNEVLLKTCDNDAMRDHYNYEETIESRFQKDRPELLELPGNEFETAEYVFVRTNGYGKFTLNNGLHEYSVSPEFAEMKVTVKQTAFEVIVCDENFREVVKHKRLYGNSKQQSMDWIPYLKRISRCPGALKYTGIIEMFPEKLKTYLLSLPKNSKGKILKTLAALTEEKGFDNAIITVEKAIEHNATDTDSLLNIHSRVHDKIISFQPVKISGSLPVLKSYTPDFSEYDKNLERR